MKPELHNQGVAMGLKPHELDHIEKQLGREPRLPELAVFAGMWSEHCSYKSSRSRLGMMPREAPYLLAGPGSHAGAVDVGEGWAVAFKIESHNHPSAVEPYQGAATGVGGILRDVIAQGARPCLVMDSLCFGPPYDAKSRHIAQGVVAGIAGYGNAIGLPNVGGKTVYDPRYEGNPLVNALAAGLVRHDGMRTAKASGIGNAVVYAGASTGRDGILGAAFASEELAENTTEQRSHVQVGDPFTGKKLMEACLSFGPEHGMVACQDMGACGLTCAASEMAALGGVGIDLDLDAVPLREAGMEPFEVLVSESQERFLFVVEAAKAAKAVAHFEHYGVHAAVVGKVVDGGQFRALWNGDVVVDLPAMLVADGAPKLNWPEAPALPAISEYAEFSPPKDLGKPLLRMLSEPGIADLTNLYDHYDHTVGNRTVRGPGEAEAAVMKLPGSARGFALTITGRGELCAVDPYKGSLAALGEATRNLACVGAPIMAITDGINHGPPSDPVENKKLTETIRGLADGLKALEIPVTGGNVSLYNATADGAIPPTPMVGAIGVVDDVSRVPRGELAGDLALILCGTPSATPMTSAYGRIASGQLAGSQVSVDLAADKRLANLLVDAIRRGMVSFAKDAGAGGLLTALGKACARGRMGATLSWVFEGRLDWHFFGETSGVAWVGVAPRFADAFLAMAKTCGVAAMRLGSSGGSRLTIKTGESSVLDVSVDALRKAFSGGAERGAA